MNFFNGDAMLWTEKYAPKRLSELVGQDAAVQTMRKWVESWKKGKPSKKSLLLYGPPGTGKTAATRALANETGWQLIEMNASDKRTMSALRKIIGEASKTGTLLEGVQGKKLLVLDEADNIHGRADHGGYQALKEIIGTTTNPVILIANDRYSIPAEIQAQCELVNFRRLRPDQIVKHLEHIAKNEKIKVDRKALEIIARRSDGDMRSAIEDFQTHALVFPRLTAEQVLLFKREREKNVFDLLRGILFASSADVARSVLWSVDIAPDEAMAWIVENVPKAIRDPKALAAVYNTLSRADIFYRRANERQIYRLWSYMSDLMSAGVAVKKGSEVKAAKFEPPSYLKRYYQTAKTRRMLNSVARKIAMACHTSTHRVKQDMIPLLPILIQNKKLLENLTANLELSEEEINFLSSLR